MEIWADFFPCFRRHSDSEAEEDKGNSKRARQEDNANAEPMDVDGKQAKAGKAQTQHSSSDDEEGQL